MALNFSFICRPSKVTKKGVAPIELTIVKDSTRTYVSLPMKVNPDDFTRAMAGRGCPEIRDYVEQARAKLVMLQTDMMRKGLPLTVSLIKEFYKNGAVMRVFSIRDLESEYIGLLKKRVGDDLTEVTVKRYEKALKDFRECNMLNEDLPADQVTPAHFIRWKAELNSKFAAETAGGWLKRVKAVYRYAFETGRISQNPGFGLKTPRGNSENVKYLDSEELKKIRSKKFGIERLQKVADCFLFSCFSGLAFSDIEALTPEDFQKNELKQVYIKKKRVKTGIYFTSVLLEDALNIAKKYDYHLPLISNQKTNAYLKEIQEICGIEKNLTFHVARHTYVAYLLNYRPQIPYETIITACGWTSEEQLRHYAKLFNITVFEDFKKLQARQAIHQYVESPDEKEAMESFEKNVLGR